MIEFIGEGNLESAQGAMIDGQGVQWFAIIKHQAPEEATLRGLMFGYGVLRLETRN